MTELDCYNFSTKDGFNSTLLKLRYQHFRNFFEGKTCLELGSADGEGTKLLLPFFEKVVAVEGSKRLIESLQKEINNPKLEAIHSYFENFSYPQKFDIVILAHILEHVDNPIQILKIGKKFLKKGGKMIIDVPNANSIHRLIGVEMGLLKSIYELNEADLSIGHRRVYDFNSLEKDINKAKLQILKKGGIFLKFLSNSQLENTLDSEQIKAFSRLGTNFPELSAEIYVICTI